MIEVSDIREIKIIVRGNGIRLYDEFEQLYKLSRIFMEDALYCIATTVKKPEVRNYILTIDKDLIIDETYERMVKNLFPNSEIEYYL